MNFENPSEQNIPSAYDILVQAEMDKDASCEKADATSKVELALFNERIKQFEESDLIPDGDGSYTTFEKKVRDVFPEVPEERFRNILIGVEMHLCRQ